jgi:predicted oxidoreductase
MYDGTLEYMQANNIIPMAYSPLGDYYKNNNPKIKKVFDLFTKKYNCSDDQLLLAWILKHPSNIYPVIGTTKAERIKNSIESFNINLETIDWFEMLEASVGKRVA